MTQQTINDQGGLIIMHPIQVADEEIYETVMNIIEDDPNMRTPESFIQLNKEAPSNFIMEAVHSMDAPILVDQNHMALLWCDKDDPTNPDMMIAVLFELIEREDRTYRKAPCGVIVGNEFQGVLQYRCPCCGTNETGFSMMFFLMNDDGRIVVTTRDTMFTENSKKRLFERVEQGVTVSSRLIDDILNHHFGRACTHDHGLLPKRIDAQAKQPFRCDPA